MEFNLQQERMYALKGSGFVYLVILMSNNSTDPANTSTLIFFKLLTIRLSIKSLKLLQKPFVCFWVPAPRGGGGGGWKCPRPITPNYSWY